VPFRGHSRSVPIRGQNSVLRLLSPSSQLRSPAQRDSFCSTIRICAHQCYLWQRYSFRALRSPRHLRKTGALRSRLAFADSKTLRANPSPKLPRHLVNQHLTNTPSPGFRAGGEFGTDGKAGRQATCVGSTYGEIRFHYSPNGRSRLQHHPRRPRTAGAV
jgi:hypothetical protein